MPQALRHPGASLVHSTSLRGPFYVSLGFHLFLFGSLLTSTILSHRGEQWGGPGGGVMTVGLVGNLSGVPLPRPDVITNSRVVDETQGLYKAEPPPQAPEPPTPAKEIPQFERNKPPKYTSRPSRVLEDPTTPPPNAVPYGQGGAPSLPYTQFTMGAATQGGMGFTGGGGGDFAGRFPVYVEGVRNRISSNWLQSTVDPSVRFAPRAVVTFQILRDGHIVNIQLLRSSGNSSVDLSALRAIHNSNPLGPLPSEYSGNNVSVEFWFDFKR
jgi:TonB family protein